jgi:cell division ATPase FtsA
MAKPEIITGLDIGSSQVVVSAVSSSWELSAW